MVTQDKESRDRPEYSLERIRALAAQGCVQYAGTRVEGDVMNLGYAPEDVHQCLQVLDGCHFHEAVRYPTTRHWLDVYRIRYPRPDGGVDPLYIKLKLNRDCVVIVLQSFHRDR